MNIFTSYKTLSRSIDGLPSPEDLSNIFLEHICEVEGVEKRGNDTIFELKITPDRGHLLSYLGLAREIAVYSDAKLKEFSPVVPTAETKTKLTVDVLEKKECLRYVGRVVEGVDGRESPLWLKETLEAVGQRSINAIVDVTNFVMLELGQPMHAFDANKLSSNENGGINIIVRNSKKGEAIETLDGKDILLPEGTLIITDDKRPLAIAGVKGGAHAGIGEDVQTIILEAATFDAVGVRKSSSAVNIRTDSSRRFEHKRAPEIALIAIERASELLMEIFKNAKAGELVDVYPRPANLYLVSLSTNDISRTLGVEYASSDLERDLARLGFSYTRIENPQEVILSRAKELVGVPYAHDSSILFDSPRSFNCSGLVTYLFLNAGIKIPRISVDQYVFGEEVSLDSLEVGDLIFSYNEGEEVFHESIHWMKGTKIPKKGIDHVGMYVGDGQIIHASRYNKSIGEKGGVLIEKLSESARFKNIVGARRISGIHEVRFSVVAPVERFDIRISADIVEEVARLIGYDKIPSGALMNDDFIPAQNDMYGMMIRARNALVALGFSEIFTYVFRREGKVKVVNPMAEGVEFLRENLSSGMQEALVFNERNAPLLGVDEIRMFEIGTVFLSPQEESLNISFGVSVTKAMKQSKKEERENEIITLTRKTLEDLFETELVWKVKNNVCEFPIAPSVNSGIAYEPLVPKTTTNPYRKISVYPFMLRDIAIWAGAETTREDIEGIIRAEAGELLVLDRLFDVFEKDLKTSYAFNLVFQSPERTLSDIEINEVMERITKKLTETGMEVR